MSEQRPIRVLHVLHSLNRGGVETWLLHLLRRQDRAAVAADFLVHATRPAAYDAEVRSLGARILPCLHPSRPWRYARNFRRILAEHGPYDVVHSHVHLFSGYVLKLAAECGVPVRIAHSHTTGTLRRLGRPLLRRWLHRYATAGLAASHPAAAALFGPAWQQDDRWRVLFCGIDLEPFRPASDSAAQESERDAVRDAVRAELAIPGDALVTGHVGRFDPVKNHPFFLAVAAEMARREERTWFLLVGDGPRRPAMEALAAELGLGDRVRFAGVRDDVPRLLKAMDLFLFPSHYEGLGLTLIEAQAAGLPVLFSDCLPAEAAPVAELTLRLPLGEPSRWADAALDRLRPAGRLAEGRHLVDGWSALAGGPFDIAVAQANLEAFYRQATMGDKHAGQGS